MMEDDARLVMPTVRLCDIKVVEKGSWESVEYFRFRKKNIYIFGSLVEIMNTDVFNIEESGKNILTSGDLLEHFLVRNGKKISDALRRELKDVKNMIKIIVNERIAGQNLIIQSDDEIIIFFPAEGSS